MDHGQGVFDSCRKVATVIVDRANYGRLKPVMEAIDQRPELSQDVICGGSTVLRRFGRTADQITADGHYVAEELYCSLEGSTPATMARGVAMAISEYTGAFERTDPDLVLMIGDRFEALGAAIAAAYTNRCIVHMQGGEVSGSIDESARHAITQLAHYHVPATDVACQRLLSMGQAPESILAIGCPSADLAASVTPNDGGREVICIYHPVTTHCEDSAGEVRLVLEALSTLGGPVTMGWPNIDAGSESIHKAIRVWREQHHANWLHMVTHIPPAEYLQRIADARLLLGNSSSFVRDASYFGTPVVLVGDRQQGRETADHVWQCSLYGITDGIERQLGRRRYPPSGLYGRPGISQQIADQLLRVPIVSQKRWCDEYRRSRTGQRRQQGHPTQEPRTAGRQTTDSLHA